MEKIQKQALQKEIEIALNEEFLAKVTGMEEGILLEFLNGQKFELCIRECD